MRGAHVSLFTMSMDMDQKRAAFELAYQRHYAGRELMVEDPDHPGHYANLWTHARDYLRGMATIAVQRQADRFNIPQRTWSERIDDVEGRLTEKFTRKQFGDPAKVMSMDAMVRVAAFRDTIDSLRRVTSPLAGALVADPTIGVVMDSAAGSVEDDIFLAIRQAMGPFRLREFQLARDVLLAVRLSTGEYPTPAILRTMVPNHMLKLCFNAAVVDINTALMGAGNVDATKAA